MLKQNKAITLIALIITIIVLLILAGVTLNMVLGENGLINKAKTSVGKYENAQEKENSALNNAEKYIDSYRETVVDNINISDAKKDLWIIWLKKANIEYTTYNSNEILSNQTLMSQLMNSEDSINYLAESYSFLLPAVLNNSTSYNELLNSTYIKKVPKMVSNTSPAGEAFSTTPFSNDFQAFKAFDENTSTDYAYSGTGSCYIGYKFDTPVSVVKFELRQRFYNEAGREGITTATLLYSDDGINYTQASQKYTLQKNTNSIQSFKAYANKRHLYWKIQSDGGYVANGGINYLQFYGI